MELINDIHYRIIKDIEQSDLDLVHKFFVVFSYMESSLKKQGFCDGDEYSVTPNWDRFANDITDYFCFDRSTDLSNAISYMVENPPRKQNFVDNSIGWRETTLNENIHLRGLLVLVRRIRNNLFHGGKFPLYGDGGEENNPDRNTRNVQLIKSALLILDECLVAMTEQFTSRLDEIRK